MPTDPLRIYWDSCVYISCIQQTTGRYDTLRKIVDLAETGQVVFVASTLVLAEVVKIKDSPLNSAAQATLIRDFFENDYVKVRDVDRKIAESAQEISRVYGILPPDAIHIATALRWKCHSLQTYDGEKGGLTKMLAFDGKIGVPAMKIELPTSPPLDGAQGQLFETPGAVSKEQEPKQ